MKLISLLLALNTIAISADVLDLGDFAKNPWRGMNLVKPSPVPLPDAVPPDTPVACWTNLPENPSIAAPRFPQDLSSYTHLCFWMYSEKANKQGLTLYLDSENPQSAGGDYYFHHMSVDWQGWKQFQMTLGDDIAPTRNPLGWNQIKGMYIHSGGWEHSPQKDTKLYIAGVKFIRQGMKFNIKSKTVQEGDDDLSTDYQLELSNIGQAPKAITWKVIANPNQLRLAGDFLNQPLSLAGETSRQFRLIVSATQPIKPFESHRLQLAAIADGDNNTMIVQELSVVCPPPHREHPCLFVTQKDIERLKLRAQNQPWAGKFLERIIAQANDILSKPLDIPDMEGQWPHHYVCKKCGVGLRYINKQHTCPKCKAVYTGWPYDQVQAGYRHGHCWNAVKLLGQAYAFTGKEDYARKAREILLAYVERYPKFNYHTVNNTQGASGGRLMAQTLDEAVSIIGVAWGYDLIYNSPCLSKHDHEQIDNAFLREVATTIRRNNAGISNWQSWHNAGVAAIGFCLNDAELIAHAIYGGSGLLFQFENSILKDGFWYEGTASYHFYALDALVWTVEAARCAGIDFTRNPAFVSLFDAPLYYVTPALTFPAINDGDVMPMRNMNGYYEWAYGRIGKPEYASIAKFGRNGDWAFFFGADTLPPMDTLSLGSRDFNGIGALVMRQKDWYVHFDYGPHGGGHGHQDKLALNIFAAGKLQAPDPGRLAYAAPMQGTWYRQTVAHNTVAVDERSQASTTGALLAFQENDDFCISQAESTGAYPGTTLHRTTGICDGVLFDVYDAFSEDEHTYDWLYHNFGTWTPKTSQPLQETSQPVGQNAGYQHIEQVRQAQTNDAWSVRIDNGGTQGLLVMNGAPGTTLYFGTGVANNPPAPCPMVVVRRKGREARFVSCVDYRAKDQAPRRISIRLLPGHTRENPQIELTIDGKAHHISLRGN